MCGVVIELKDGELLVLGYSFDDNKWCVYVIDGEDVSMQEAIFEEGANVLVFLELFDRATPFGQHFLHRGRSTFRSCCYFMRRGSSYKDKLSTICLQFLYPIIVINNLI